MGKRDKFIDLRDKSRFKRSQPCPKCGGDSKVDWIDLVRQTAAHTCSECKYYWIDFTAQPAT